MVVEAMELIGDSILVLMDLFWYLRSVPMKMVLLYRWLICSGISSSICYGVDSFQELCCSYLITGISSESYDDVFVLLLEGI